MLLEQAGISKDKPAIYAFGTPIARKVIPEPWVSVPYHLMPELQGTS
jgi:hypothetical protein